MRTAHVVFLVLAVLTFGSTAVAGEITAEDAKKHLVPPVGESETGEPIDLTGDGASIVHDVFTDPGELPRFKIEVDGKLYELPLKHTHVEARLVGDVAHVEVRQTYENPLPTPIETVYVFPLPENSAVNDLEMVIGDRIIRADIKERDEARKTYEEAKEKGHTAALLEQERPNIFTQSVANIAPNEKIEVVISYVQDLTYDAGEYEFVFPMVVGPRYIPGKATGKNGTGWSPDTTEVGDASRITPPIVGGGMRTGHDISLHMTVDAGLEVKEFGTPTHQVAAEQTNSGLLDISLAEIESIPNRDFVLRYSVAGAAPAATLMTHDGDKGGHFTLMVQPPELDIETLVGERELVFIVDVSGSMNGKPLAMCKAAMQQSLRTLRPTDTFNVIVFASREDMLWNEPRPANDTNLRDAIGFIDGLSAGGGTEMKSAIDAAFSMEGDKNRHRFVFFMTDGFVGNEDGILDKTEEYVKGFGKVRKGKKARVFGLGVGSSPNRYLMEGLGAAGDGTTVYATNREDPTRAVNRFFSLVDHPVITDIEIDWGGLKATDVYPSDMPDLFASRPLVLHGKYSGSGDMEIKVRGKVDGDDIELSVPVSVAKGEHGDPVHDTLWARAKVGDLQQDLWAGVTDSTKQAMIEVGLDYRLVTQFTSLVAVDYERTVEGKLEQIVQPVDAAEGVDMDMAAPAGAVINAPHPAPSIRHQTSVKVKKRTRGNRAEESRKSVEKDMVAAEVEAQRPSLTPYQAKKLVEEKMDKFQACYAKQAKKNADLRGTMKIRIEIGTNGKVLSVELVRDTLDNTKVTACVTKVAKKMKFPEFEGNAIVVEIPLVFAP